jgi:hypothetical protein
MILQSSDDSDLQTRNHVTVLGTEHVTVLGGELAQWTPES